MAADHIAQPSDGAEPNDDRRESSARLGQEGGTAPLDEGGREHDLSYLRTRRARANDPRRSLNAAFAGQSEAPNVVSLRRAAPPSPPPPVPEVAPSPRLLGRSRSFWLLSAALFALVAGVTFGIFYWRQTSAERAAVSPEIVRAPAATPVPSSLRMHVEVQGERVLVSWDPRASGVIGTTGGVLTIDDSGRQSQFPLDATQAANGSVLYRPDSGNVTFRLQIRNASGAVFNDSLRVFDPAKTASVAEKTARQTQTAAVRHLQIDGAPAKHSLKLAIAAHPPERSAYVSRSKRVAEQVAAPRSERRIASDSASLARMPASAPAIVPPAQTVAGTALPVEFAQGALAASVTPPEPANRTRAGTTGVAIGTVSAAQRGTSGHAKDDGIFLPPQPVKQVMPKLRSSLLSVIPPGDKVGVVVSIDTHGRVKQAKIAPVSKNIDIGVQKAVLDAAKQWRFAPAWRNGKKVDAERTIYFQF